MEKRPKGLRIRLDNPGSQDRVSIPIALWLPGYLGILGLLALFGTSAGAIYFHLRFDTWKDGIPAMITLSFSVIVIYARFNSF